MKKQTKSIRPKTNPITAIPVLSSLPNPSPPNTIAIIPKRIPPQNKPIIPHTNAAVP